MGEMGGAVLSACFWDVPPAVLDACTKDSGGMLMTHAIRPGYMCIRVREPKLVHVDKLSKQTHG